MGNRERICRLCLQKCDQNFKNIKGNVREAVEILVPKINLAISYAPVMCTNCAKTLEKCFDFKRTCISTHRSIVSCVDRKVDVKSNLKYLHLIKKETDNIISSQGHNTCGLCTRKSESCSNTSLDTEGEKMMFKECFPELDLSITKICVICHESLKNCFHFITKCLITEEKIQKYGRDSSINDDGVVELNRLPRVTIQLEQIFCNDGANSKAKVGLKDEIFMEMGDQKYHDIEHFTLEDMSSCLEQDNTIDAIKKEGELLEETENNIEHICENFIKKEDRNFLVALEVDKDKIDVIKVEEEFFEEVETKIEYESENCIEMEKRESKNLQFTRNVPSMEVELNQIELFKPEETFHEDKETANGKVELKLHNFLETEYHKFNSPFHFTSNHILTCEEDCTKFDVSKIEKICSEKGENDAESENSYLATMDVEQKYNLNEEVDIKPDLQSTDRFEDDIVLPELEADPSKPCINRMSIHKAIPEIRNRKPAVVHKDPLEVTVYKCDFCLYHTKRKGDLKPHLLIHKNPSEVTIYKCDSCQYQTKRKANLICHMLRHKDPSEVQMYKCDFCSYQTKHKPYLKCHLLTHKDSSEVTVYKCDFCSFQTRSKQYFGRHFLIHKNPLEVTMYKCGSCVYQTKRKDNLVSHMRIHKNPSDVTMYTCDFCSVQVTRKTDLKRHFLTHKNSLEV